jgi:AcrR family transcriptional regulator
MSKSRSRGRPRTLDKNDALEVIAKTFQTKGYLNTSLDDLTEATGLSRPSLYAAYGNKLATFLKTLKSRISESHVRTMRALNSTEDLEQALIRFYDTILDTYFIDPGRGNNGCLLFTSAPTCCHIEEVESILSKTTDNLDKIISGRMHEVLRTANVVDIDAGSELVTNTLIGLCTRARSGASLKELKKMARRSSKFIAEHLT